MSGEHQAPDPTVITGDLRWPAIGNLIGELGNLVTTAGKLMAATQGASKIDDDRRQELVDGLIAGLGGISAAVDFAVAFLDHDQRSKVREHFRDERNKMQHEHWSSSAVPA